MKALLSIIFLTATTLLFGQEPAVITYADIDDFTWDLFEGRINKKHLHEMGHNTGAVTVSSLSYTILQTSPKHARITITARFHPEESWTKYPHLKDEKDALRHEKGHLDITEIYARRIRKIVADVQFSADNFKGELKQLFQKVAKDHSNEQIKYDRETNHSINKEEQLKWDAWIAGQLESLSPYTVPEIELHLQE